MDADPNRGTGRTTRQMRELPQGGIFVVAHAPMRSYARALAQHLGRPDIRVETIYWFKGVGWRGLRPTGVAVDHFTREYVRQNNLWRELEAWMVAWEYWHAHGVPVL